jgi:hypothetical protein
MIADITPMNMLCGMPTKPAPGVMATSPTTAPIQNPLLKAFFLLSHRRTSRKTCSTSSCVGCSKCGYCKPFAPKADPALKPNQPNHKRPVPIKYVGYVCRWNFASINMCFSALEHDGSCKCSTTRLKYALLYHLQNPVHLS